MNFELKSDIAAAKLLRLAYVVLANDCYLDWGITVYGVRFSLCDAATRDRVVAALGELTINIHARYNSDGEIRWVVGTPAHEVVSNADRTTAIRRAVLLAESYIEGK